MTAAPAWQTAFELAPDVTYLNHAGVAPWPRRAAEAAAAFAAENARQGARHYPDWLRVERRLRERLARLLNAPSPDDIALLKNTSEGLSFAAAGIDWRAGDNVIISDQEFPSNRLPWEALAPRGVEVRVARLGVEDPEAALIACLDGRTRALAVSAVQFGTGMRMDLERLGAACRANGTLFVVDAIQQAGALRLDLQAVHADIAVADGHKWLCGPEGVAFFYVRAGVRERLALTQFGWHMVEQVGDYDRLDWTPARSARRFECGSPNLLGIHALEASLSVLEEAGMEIIERRVLAATDRLARGAAALPGWSVISRRDANRASGILTLRHASGEHAAIFARLRDAGVVCAERGGGIRLSPHFYQDDAVLDRAIDLLERSAPR